MKYSANELELLGVVWASEHFRNYLYGTEFKIVIHHKALLSALSANDGNKTMHSRLTRWENTFLPLNFKISHLPGKDMGFTDLLSRLPSGKALPTYHYDDEFVVASIDKIQKILLNRPHSNSVVVNTVDRPAVAVNTYSLVNNNIPSGIENSSDVIGQNILNSSSLLQSQDYCCYHIFVARSIKICHNHHTRTENCTSNCLTIDNSNFNFKSITFSDKVLLHFILENRQFYHLLKRV